METLDSRRSRRGPRLFSPTEGEIEQARASSLPLQRALARLEAVGAEGGGVSPIRVTVRDEGGVESELSLPPSILAALGRALAEMAVGNSLMLLPLQDRLTTQEAADILNVSRPFVTKLIDQGELPAQMVGTHRRILLDDLMEYKRRSDEECERALDEIAALGQELDMGY